MIPSQLGKGYGVGGYGEGYFGGTGIPYYLSLVAPQYQNSPRMLAWLTALLTPIDDLFQAAVNLEVAFDIDWAEGVQLDVLGQIVGASRTVDFQPSNGVSPVLDDDTYRILLKAKVAQNHWDGRIASLQAIWKDLFPGGTIGIVDHQNMSIDVTLSGAFSSIILDLINNGLIVTRPEGVLINTNFATGPYFGLDRDDDYVAGLDKGKLT